MATLKYQLDRYLKNLWYVHISTAGQLLLTLLKFPLVPDRQSGPVKKLWKDRSCAPRFPCTHDGGLHQSIPT